MRLNCERHTLHNFESSLPQRLDLRRVVRHHTYRAQPEVEQDFSALFVAAHVSRKAESLVSLDGVCTLILQCISANLVDDADAAPFLLLVDDCAVSGVLDRRVGDWVRAIAGRQEEPSGRLLRTARWLTEPARHSLWHRVLSEVDLTPARRPLLFQTWLPVVALVVGVALVVVAGVVPNTALTIIASVLAGLVVTIGAALWAGSWFVRRQRRRIQAWIESRIPPISEPRV